jgi:DNA/RNA-binding domain of Phe-tRNA-synthetase-like protein
MNTSNTIGFTEIIKNKIPGLKLGVLIAHKISIRKKSDLAKQAFCDLENIIRNEFAENPPSSNEIVAAVRKMYRRIGWEPTQYRPSSEAMIRRFLKRKGLYRINNMVDLGNVASTRFHLPMGLYDLDKISGNVLLDVGKEDETYEGISKELIHAEGKLILRDDSGIFGNPTADSKRTCLQTETKNIKAIFFVPPEVTDSWLDQTLDYLEHLYHQESPDALINRKIVVS